MSSSPHPRRIAACALTAVAGLAGAAGIAAAAGSQSTTVSIAPRVLIAAPQRSPVDFAGVPAARAGQPLPKGYVVVARDVRITRGDEVAYGAMRMSCPQGKTWRTGGSKGDVGMNVLDRRVSKKRSVLVMATFNAGETAVGQTVSGTVYTLCR